METETISEDNVTYIMDTTSQEEVSGHSETLLSFDANSFLEEGQEVMLPSGERVILKQQPDGTFTAHPVESTTASPSVVENTVMHDASSPATTVTVSTPQFVEMAPALVSDSSVEEPVFSVSGENPTTIFTTPDGVMYAHEDSSSLNTGEEMVLIQGENGEGVLYLERTDDSVASIIAPEEKDSGVTTDGTIKLDSSVVVEETFFDDGVSFAGNVIKTEKGAEETSLDPDEVPFSEFKCDMCDKSYSSLSSLKRHQAHAHGLMGNKRTTYDYVCLETDCGGAFFGKFELIRHLRSEHQIELEIIDTTFENAPDFFAWLEEFQDRTCTRFVKVTGAKFGATGFITANYVCHRSGKPRLKSLYEERQRRHRTFGSCKTGVMCTAHVRVHEMDGLVRVNGCATHYGHEMDPRHMTLLPSHKAKILAFMDPSLPLYKLANILRDLQTDPNSAIHYLATAECRNLQAMIGRLNSYLPIAHKLSELRQQECPSLTAHKEVGVLYENFDKDDYFAVFQSPEQLKQWSAIPDQNADAVCVDVIHHIDYCLLTIWILVYKHRYSGVERTDSNDCAEVYSFPGAFCITNCRQPHTIIQHFYQQVFEISGHLDAELFFSDDHDDYYLNWLQIFGSKRVPRKLISLWHVQYSIEKKAFESIQEHSKVVFVCKRVRKLLTIDPEPESLESFTSDFSEFLNALDSDDYFPFRTFLEEQYTGRTLLWGPCYLGAPILHIYREFLRRHNTMQLFCDHFTLHRLTPRILDTLANFQPIGPICVLNITASKPESQNDGDVVVTTTKGDGSLRVVTANNSVKKLIRPRLVLQRMTARTREPPNVIKRGTSYIEATISAPTAAVPPVSSKLVSNVSASSTAPKTTAVTAVDRTTTTTKTTTIPMAPVVVSPSASSSSSLMVSSTPLTVVATATPPTNTIAPITALKLPQKSETYSVQALQLVLPTWSVTLHQQNSMGNPSGVDRVFRVIQKAPSCSHRYPCDSKCTHCILCRHQYYCSCMTEEVQDSVLCKHIHLISSFNQVRLTQPSTITFRDAFPDKFDFYCEMRNTLHQVESLMSKPSSEDVLFSYNNCIAKMQKLLPMNKSSARFDRERQVFYFEPSEKRESVVVVDKSLNRKGRPSGGSSSASTQKTIFPTPRTTKTISALRRLKPSTHSSVLPEAKSVVFDLVDKVVRELDFQSKPAVDAITMQHDRQVLLIEPKTSFFVDVPQDVKLLEILEAQAKSIMDAQRNGPLPSLQETNTRMRLCISNHTARSKYVLLKQGEDLSPAAEDDPVVSSESTPIMVKEQRVPRTTPFSASTVRTSSRRRIPTQKMIDSRDTEELLMRAAAPLAPSVTKIVVTGEGGASFKRKRFSVIH